MAETQWTEGYERAMRVAEAHLVNNREARDRVVAHASRMIDVLTGVSEEATVTPRSSEDFSSAPAGIPELHWRSQLGLAVRDDEDFVMEVVGSLGGFYARLFSDERPSAVLHVGFYAGVLAAKAGLVDVDQFHHDSERKALAAEQPAATEA